MSLQKKNIVSKSSFWDDLYLNDSSPWDLNSPTPIFINWSENLPKNKKLNICIPGCGKGHDALYLSSKGHNVYAIDFSCFATGFLKNNAKKNNLKINVINDNFFELNTKYENYFDVVLEYTFFCAIDPSKRKKYVSKCYDLLKKNGLIVGVFLPLIKNNEVSPPFQVSIKEIKHLFSEKFNFNKIKFSSLSVKSRKDNEVYIELLKK